MSDDASQEEKQNYLRENILDKGYDANVFLQFLIDKRGEDAADVENWTMNDLQLVVKEFIKLNGGEVEEEKKPPKKISMFDVIPEGKTKNEPVKQKPKQENKQPPQQPPQQQPKQNQKTNNTVKDNKPEEKKPQTKPNTAQNKANNNTNTANNNANNKANSNINTNANKVNKVSNINNNTQNRSVSMSMAFTGSESEYGIITADSKTCKPTDKTQLGKSSKLEITVTNPEKKETGFLKKTHVTYLITTLPQNFKVRRRFSDIDWFRQSLLNIFPINLIPPAPKKTRFGDTLAEAFVLKRARGAQRFLNYLVKDPIIKDSQILLDFLYIGSESDFNNKKKVYENVKNLSEVKDFKSNDEKVNLLISPQHENYLENIKDNANININLLKKLNNSFKLLYQEMNAVIARMDEISNYWNQIHKVSLKYYDMNATCESFKQMRNLFKKWSKILREQNNVVNVDIREHFKFIRKNFSSMKDLGNSVEPIKSNYQKLSKNLIMKKEDLFKKGEIQTDPRSKSDYGVANVEKVKVLQSMLPKETGATIIAKEIYGLYLNRAINEYERMRDINGILNKEIVVENATKLMNIMSQLHICVGEMNIGLETSILNKGNDNKCKERRIPLDESLLK